MRPLGVCSPLLVFVSPVTRRLQRVLTPAWTTLSRMDYRSLSNRKQWGANEERGENKALREAWLVIACLFMADFGSILFVFQFVNKIVNKMNAFSVSNLHRATATRFWRGTARRGRVSRLFLGSGGGTDRRSGSKHENVLSTVCVFQRCSAFPCASTADEDIPTRTSANRSGCSHLPPSN